MQLAANPVVGEFERNHSTHDLDCDSQESDQHRERAPLVGELLWVAADGIES
jgi:hypothetical protein